MTEIPVYELAAAALVAIGLRGLIVRRGLIRRILAVNIAGAGVFLLLVALAARAQDPGPDPVPHAMVLTGIVVAVSATSLAVAIARRLAELTGGSDLPDDDGEDVV
jgi:multicomponent Na+:H+ antiporter subunit C